MRVLHVSSGQIYGGIETALVSLARHRGLCPDLEHQFALCFAGRLSGELQALGVRVFMLGDVQLSRPLSVRRARRALRLAIQHSACDVVICHGPRSMVFFARVVRALRTPLVMWVHGVRARRYWLNWLVSKTLPDLAICNSQFTLEAFAGLFPKVTATVIYYPVDRARLQSKKTVRAEVREELCTPPNAVVIVMVARMESWKGHRLLIEALVDLGDDDTWYCWIAGGVQSRSGQLYFDDLVEQVRSKGLAERIHFIGQRSDVPRILSAADIFCQPNQQAEPFGVVFVEAMLAGLPIVTSAIGAAVEVVDLKSGILVPANDRQALATALKNLLHDPLLRHQLGAAGPARAHELCEPAKRLGELQTVLETIHSPSKE